MGGTEGNYVTGQMVQGLVGHRVDVGFYPEGGEPQWILSRGVL